jgi:threonine dehydrogenase-like Zn-dependent dehydrogenase
VDHDCQIRKEDKQMKAATYAGQGRIELQEVPIPMPGPGEVLLRVRVSALCGSELHAYQSPHPRDEIAGHEAVGEVVSAPSDSGLVAGQHVAVQVLSGCGNCEFCLSGDPEHCAHSRFHGGTHAEYMAVPAMCCRPVPADIPLDQAVLLGGDTIGTPYHALHRLGISAADTVAVFGCGPIGLGAITLLRFFGAAIIAVEPIAYRRELACRLGAEIALDPEAEDAVARIHGLTSGQGASVTLDCSPEAATTAMALESVAIHARVAFIGEKPDASIHPSPQFIRKELTAIGSWYFTGPDYFRILGLYRRGLDLSGLVTHRFSLEDADQAFATFASHQSGKVLLVSAL